MEPIRIFIGYDPREKEAFEVLAHSIWRRASQPVSITPLVKSQLGSKRTGGSTEFAFTRFLVPYLCGYEGHAIFMDSDMLCLGDIAELWNLRGPTYWLPGPAVKVVKHVYRPTETTKFLGAKQEPYERKNWSSVMLFDNGKCHKLTPDYVETAPGLDLHQFKWTTDDRIGDLPESWNYLVGHSKTTNPKLIHYTLGGPWFPEYEDCEYSNQWRTERGDAESRSEFHPNRDQEAGSTASGSRSPARTAHSER